ncbi:65-kDa microtubule-associated protein 6-like isoform X2 [Dioscorea cayenensis subsp. rotundata]|uniref:65-kDa microtubule-associated protein 6-like isoform X2 n=1 Tax=Dioscorea cayennensis subsp. rotundata TaxID=55577 RepID=A0AB40BAZ7_DIOCR|nr:65-kDa microtubule-associated protein 6-like isoform X2 [Dioscorea cayenensis subsp. rotundata]
MGEVMEGFGGSMERSCASLLKELEDIWKEMGESEEDKDLMLLELERECLLVYGRKVEEASKLRAQLHHSLAIKEAEVAALMASLGEHNLELQMEKKSSSLKKRLALVTPLLEDLRVRKEERVKQFSVVSLQIRKLRMEIAGYCSESNTSNSSFNIEEHEHDLSLRKLNDCQTQLQVLQKEKSDRLHKVLECVNDIHSLCAVLGLDFRKIVDEVHPSLHEAGLERYTYISDSILDGLTQVVLKLKKEKEVRLRKLRETMESLLKLWNMMDSSEQERKPFEKLTCIVGSLNQNATLTEVLSLETIEQAEAEVQRLTELKTSRMKEIVLKRRLELEEICREAHLEPDMSTSLEKCIALIESDLVDSSELVATIEAQILKAKEEVLSRKEIMDKINKWMASCDEENWLDEYNQDENRYMAGRGAHLNLKRAEKARVIISKLPAMVDNLITRTFVWEDEHNMPFFYDGVRLVSILEEYKLSRLKKEQQKKLLRDQKKLQSLLLAEKESIYGSKPSPRKSKINGSGFMTPMVRRNSFGGRTPELLTPHSYSGPRGRFSTTPFNFVALSKEDTSSSSASLSGSELGFGFHAQLQI